MLCAAEIGTFVWGIVVLVTGKLTLSRNQVVTGVMARVIGFILFIPLPLMLMAGILYGVHEAANGREVGQKQQINATIVEFIFVVFFLVLALGLALAFAEKPRKRGRKDGYRSSRRGYYSSRYDDEDDDYGPRRRLYEDGDDDDLPRRRRRDEEDDDDRGSRHRRYDDEEDDRPRRRREDDDVKPRRRDEDKLGSKRRRLDENNDDKPVRRSERSVSGAQEDEPLIPPPLPQDPGHGLVRCDQCQAQLKIGSAHLGKTVKCPKCKAVFQAPTRQELDGITGRNPANKSRARATGDEPDA